MFHERLVYIAGGCILIAGILLPLFAHFSSLPDRDADIRSEIFILEKKIRQLEQTNSHLSQKYQEISQPSAKSNFLPSGQNVFLIPGILDIFQILPWEDFLFLSPEQKGKIHQILSFHVPMTSPFPSIPYDLSMREKIEEILSPAQRKMYYEYLKKYKKRF